jgi:hypothetical protein
MTARWKAAEAEAARLRDLTREEQDIFLIKEALRAFLRAIAPDYRLDITKRSPVSGFSDVIRRSKEDDDDLRAERNELVQLLRDVDLSTSAAWHSWLYHRDRILSRYGGVPPVKGSQESDDGP